MVQASLQRTKVVVRRLPPGLTEDGFKSALDKVAEGQYTWFSYHQGKVSARKTVLSRAFLNFSEPVHVIRFKTSFDGHVFVTTKGKQYRCTVEYAPYQKVPKPPARKNPLEGTIDQDPHYQAFLAELQAGPQLLPSAAAQRDKQDKDKGASALVSTPASTVKEVKSSPLLDYLNSKAAGGPPGSRKGAKDSQQQRAGSGRGGEGPSKGGEGGKGAGKGKGSSQRTGDDKATASAAASAAAAAALSKDSKPTPTKTETGKAQASGGGKDTTARPHSGKGAGRDQPKTTQQTQSAQPAPKTLLSRPKDAATAAETATASKPTPKQQQQPRQSQQQPSQQSQPQQQQGHKGGRRPQPAADKPAEPPAETSKGRSAAARPASGASSAAATAGAAGASAAAAAAAAAAAVSGRPAADTGARAAADAARRAAARAVLPTTAASAQPAAAAAGGDAAASGDQPAAPARRVRAGFQLYRPPVRHRPTDEDSG